MDVGVLMREVIEYRAVVVPTGLRFGEPYECSDWSADRRKTERWLAPYRRSGSGCKDSWLERRTAIYGEPERVKEGESDE